MKLIIQIPCLNEEQVLGVTVAALPRSLPGMSSIEYLVIDDGSDDRTAEVARAAGVHHVIGFPRRRGLARAYMAGIDACLKLGADIIVNTDADNQYSADDIQTLLQPILERRADIVVGDRQLARASFIKRILQRLGSSVVRQVSQTLVADATSGFRAITREAALRTIVTSDFTYTFDTLIQAGQAHLTVASVPIRTNATTRPSRLFGSIPEYLRRSGTTIARTYTLYRPLSAFVGLASLFFTTGCLLGARFLYFYLTESGSVGHVPSLILAAILLIAGFVVLLSGILADLVSSNRKLLEDIIVRLRRLEYGGPRSPDKSE